MKAIAVVISLLGMTFFVGCDKKDEISKKCFSDEEEKMRIEEGGGHFRLAYSVPGYAIKSGSGELCYLDVGARLIRTHNASYGEQGEKKAFYCVKENGKINRACEGGIQIITSNNIEKGLIPEEHRGLGEAVFLFDTYIGRNFEEVKPLKTNEYCDLVHGMILRGLEERSGYVLCEVLEGPSNLEEPMHSLQKSRIKNPCPVGIKIVLGVEDWLEWVRYSNPKWMKIKKEKRLREAEKLFN